MVNLLPITYKDSAVLCPLLFKVCAYENIPHFICFRFTMSFTATKTSFPKSPIITHCYDEAFGSGFCVNSNENISDAFLNKFFPLWACASAFRNVSKFERERVFVCVQKRD